MAPAVSSCNFKFQDSHQDPGQSFKMQFQVSVGRIGLHHNAHIPKTAYNVLQPPELDGKQQL